MEDQGKIAREIAAGFVVVCDRYLQSTLAYQGAAAPYEDVKLLLEGLGRGMRSLYWC